MTNLVLGAIAMGSVVVAVFFLKFWRSTRDRFFLFFAVSFFLQSLNRLIQAFIESTPETVPAVYSVRLVAFSLILYAIFDKNWPRKKAEAEKKS